MELFLIKGCAEENLCAISNIVLATVMKYIFVLVFPFFYLYMIVPFCLFKSDRYQDIF
jgi:hypothetical protein